MRNEIVVKTPEDLIALLREARLAALREALAIVADVIRSLTVTTMEAVEIRERLDALIAKEQR